MKTFLQKINPNKVGQLSLVRFATFWSLLNTVLIAITFAVATTESVEADRELQRQRAVTISNLQQSSKQNCEDNNRQDAVLTAILKTSETQRKQDTTRPPLNEAERAILKESYAKLKGRDCAHLPALRVDSTPTPPR